MRDITTRDLIGLRDIGPIAGAGESPLAISPDGHEVAFVLTRGDPDANDYCQALVVIDLRRGAVPRLVDTGRGIILTTPIVRGLRSTSGSVIANTPRWSPDGRSLAYLRLEEGIVQARTVSLPDKHAVTVTQSTTNVRRIAWSADGRRLLFANEPALVGAVAAQERESLGGFLYDDKFVPSARNRPSLEGSIPLAFQAIELAIGKLVPLTESDRRVFDPKASSVLPEGARLSAEWPFGPTAWTIKRDQNNYVGKVDLWARLADGTSAKCNDPACISGLRGIEAMWWVDGGRTLLFLRRGGWGDSQNSLYRWTPRGRVSRALVTDDLLSGCRLAGPALVCLREASSRPRQIVLIDIHTGKTTPLFDPNPEFSSLRLGSVTRLRWRNAFGLESFGDLVVPFGHRPGERLPMIVVQYISRGFLRGGVGDEYPIFPLAAEGFAVLSLQRPPDFYETVKDGSLRSIRDAQVADQREWQDRRSVHSSLLGGVAIAVSRGIADPRKLAITGSSDGAATVQFALVNAPGLFAAAAVSSGFMEPLSTQVFGGQAWAAQLVDLGYPTLETGQSAFWQPMSVGMHADSINSPILFQVADDEYLLALESYSLLKAHRRSTELYVFPNEYHIKWQPAHRFSIYNRNVDWFRYWLLGHVDADPSKDRQYARWRSLSSTVAPTPLSTP
ncbi:Atxe2 family lasso peptide isopeptidase [Sphingomonas panacis]|nr:Atxe2 family lasso peptide isopeptidase [Sphingomonas panacis]